jgi:hAT family C-terminal dimerisation region
MKQVKCNKESREQTTLETNSDSEDEFFELGINGKSEKSFTKEEISEQILLENIKTLGKQEKIKMKEDVLEYYETLKTKGLISDDLFDMAMIALSAPATQVSVERAFSAFGLVMTPKRSSLRGKSIDNILMCNLNRNLLNLFNFEVPNPPHA